MTDSRPGQDPGGDCDIPNRCERTVPAWLIVLDNAPTAVLFLLGASILWRFGPVPALLFFAYCCLSIVLFWRLICPWCHHFGTRACPCGYAVIASRFFRKRTGREFKRVFRRNILIVFPAWFIPLGAGIFLLWTDYDRVLLILFLSFCLVGFVLIPAISRLVGCRSCEIKNQCPWMS